MNIFMKIICIKIDLHGDVIFIVYSFNLNSPYHPLSQPKKNRLYSKNCVQERINKTFFLYLFLWWSLFFYYLEKVFKRDINTLNYYLVFGPKEKFLTTLNIAKLYIISNYIFTFIYLFIYFKIGIFPMTNKKQY